MAKTEALIKRINNGDNKIFRALYVRLEDEQAQITWERECTFPSNAAISSPEVLVGEAVRQYLEARGEPARYLPVYTAGLLELAAGRFFRISSVIPHETQGSDSGQSSLEAAAHDGTHSLEEVGKTTTSNVSPVDQFNQVVGILRETLSYRVDSCVMGRPKPLRPGNSGLATLRIPNCPWQTG